MSREEKRRLLLISIILMCICLTTAGTAISLLYETAVEQKRNDLVVTAQSQARLIEAVIRHDQRYARFLRDEYPGYDPLEASLNQVVIAHENFQGFGDSGEFTIARKIDQQIILLFRHHANELTRPQPVAFDSILAEPMRRALSGKSGTMVGLDYRGVTVLAAYEPVTESGLGIVAKLDLAEVRRPFYVAGGIAIAVTLVLIFLGVYLLRRALIPLFSRLHRTTEELAAEMEQHRQALAALGQSEERFRQIADVADDVFWLVGCENPEQPRLLRGIFDA